MSFSNKTIEREYLLSAPGHIVLEYLDACGAKLDGRLFAKESWALNDEEAALLFARNDRVVDIGLARVCDDKLAVALLERYTDASGSPDSAVLEALLSNRIACQGLLSPPAWLATQLEHVAKAGPMSMFETMFKNASMPHEVLDAALEGAGPFKGLDDERRVALLYAVLAHPAIVNFRKNERESSDYDLAGHETMRNVWMLLLREDPSPRNVWILLEMLKALDSDLEAPSEKELARYRGLADDAKTFDRATLDFLKLAIPRWVSDKADFDQTACGPLRQLVAAAVSQHDANVKAWLLDNPDPFVRRGAYERVDIKDPGELTQLFQKDGQNFLFGAVMNDGLYRPGNVKLSKAFYELVSEHGDESPGEYQPTAFGIYSDRFEELSKRHPGRYPPEPYEWGQWKPSESPPDVAASESESERFAHLARRLDAIEGAVKALDGSWKIWIILALVAGIAWRLA